MLRHHLDFQIISWEPSVTLNFLRAVLWLLSARIHYLFVLLLVVQIHLADRFYTTKNSIVILKSMLCANSAMSSRRSQPFRYLFWVHLHSRQALFRFCQCTARIQSDLAFHLQTDTVLQFSFWDLPSQIYTHPQRFTAPRRLICIVPYFFRISRTQLSSVRSRNK